MGTLPKAWSSSSSWAFCLWLLSTRPLSPPRVERLHSVHLPIGDTVGMRSQMQGEGHHCCQTMCLWQNCGRERSIPSSHPYPRKFQPGSRNPRVPGSIAYPGVSPPGAMCILAAALPQIAESSSYTSLYFEDLVGLWARASVASSWRESHPAWGLGRGRGCGSRGLLAPAEFYVISEGVGRWGSQSPGPTFPKPYFSFQNDSLVTI